MKIEDLITLYSSACLFRNKSSSHSLIADRRMVVVVVVVVGGGVEGRLFWYFIWSEQTYIFMLSVLNKLTSYSLQKLWHIKYVYQLLIFTMRKIPRQCNRCFILNKKVGYKGRVHKLYFRLRYMTPHHKGVGSHEPDLPNTGLNISYCVNSLNRYLSLAYR